MGINEKAWKAMEMHENQRKSMQFNGKAWKPMTINEKRMKSMKSMEFNGKA